MKQSDSSCIKWVKGNSLLALRRLGQSAWLDFISRDILASGELRRLIEDDGVTGVTSNPTIFEKSINSSSAYDGEIKRLAVKGKTAEEIGDVLTTLDVGEAADLLKPVFQRTRGSDGFVSIEVSPHCAYDAPTTVECAHRIFSSLGRQNILIKVPATEAGAAAMEELIAAGVNVNATLIFSLSHYQRVANAYINALKRRREQGRSLGEVHSVASVFVSRIDTAVDKILETLAGQDTSPAGEIRDLKGRAAVANSSLIYQRFRELFSGDEFIRLKNSGARIQKIVWGSTSTKDPNYSDIKYVAELIGRNTVNTIPLATLKAFKDHGLARTTLARNAAAPGITLNQLRRLGIDIDALCQQIQDDGVKAFVDSYDTLVASIEKKRRNCI